MVRWCCSSGEKAEDWYLLNQLVSEFYYCNNHSITISETYFLDDPNLKSAVPLPYLSQKEQYEETLRCISVTTKRFQQWHAEGNGPLEYSDQ